jgi:hypothetical protein
VQDDEGEPGRWISDSLSTLSFSLVREAKSERTKQGPFERINATAQRSPKCSTIKAPDIKVFGARHIVKPAGLSPESADCIERPSGPETALKTLTGCLAVNKACYSYVNG